MDESVVEQRIRKSNVIVHIMGKIWSPLRINCFYENPKAQDILVFY